MYQKKDNNDQNYKKSIAIRVGNRLRNARDALGFTQEQVSDCLGIGRPRYSDIENGKRNISIKDIYKLAEFFNRPIEYFFKENIISESGFRLLFRKSKGNAEIAKIITEFEGLCQKMHDLEEINEIKSSLPILKDYDFDISNIKYWGKHYATYERDRLGLGRAPIKDLNQVLEEKCGLKIFYLYIPEEYRIYGMFTYDENIGGSILVNLNSSYGRQRFSLAHEYAHFLFHKNRIGVISFEKDERTLDERIADYFASEFLMPEQEVIDIFKSTIKNKRDITAEDIIHFADYFGVSFTAMVYKLNNIRPRLIDNNKKEDFIKGTWVNQLREAIGLPETQKNKSKFPPLYYHLCIKAYKQDKITTAKFADFLEMPLYQAMEIGGQLRKKPVE
jgi:Zn-dependent peptidase ImmA (M78 family)/transcriptional regulator with XRE-family HTH domain